MESLLLLLLSPDMETTTTYSIFDGIVTFCCETAPMAALIVFAAPIPTMQHISNEGSVGSLPLLPYTTMIMSSFLWLSYGICKNERIIWMTNIVGFCFGIIYMYQFCKYIPSTTDVYATLPGSVRQHIFGVIIVMSMTLLFIFFMKNSSSGSSTYGGYEDILGNIAVLFCIGLFSSPLTAMKTVIQTRDSRSIPLPFTIATVINCLLWTIVGWFHMHDNNVIIPNALGLLFGIIQLVLKCIYGNAGQTSNDAKRRRRKKDPLSGDDNNEETGLANSSV